MESKTFNNSTGSLNEQSTTSGGNGSLYGSVISENPILKEDILINVQFAFFFDKLISKPEDLWQLVNSEMDGIFDLTPIIFPVPNEHNFDDVPVVQMRSSSGAYSCNIARGRIDFIRAGTGKQTFSIIKDDYKNEVLKIFSFLTKDDSAIKIKRIGFVTNIFIEDEKQDETLKKILSDTFTQIFSDVTNEVFARYVTRIKIDEYNTNNFITIGRFNARISGVPKPIPGVLVTRDFNTIPEDNYSDKFDSNKINTFIDKGVENFKLDELKKILWPTK